MHFLVELDLVAATLQLLLEVRHLSLPLLPTPLLQDWEYSLLLLDKQGLMVV
jgi:hypothetical protein